MSICECISVISADARVLTVSMSMASFVDRDMMMRHFGSGIGHVNSAACQQNNDEDNSDLGSELDLDAMDSIPSPQRQVSDSENVAMGISEESEENHSDLEDRLDSTSSSSGSDDDELSESESDDELSDSESDDDGYASF